MGESSLARLRTVSAAELLLLLLLLFDDAEAVLPFVAAVWLTYRPSFNASWYPSANKPIARNALSIAASVTANFDSIGLEVLDDKLRFEMIFMSASSTLSGSSFINPAASSS